MTANAVLNTALIEIRAKLTKVRGRIAAAECECLVNGECVSSAELLFTIADSPNG